MITKNEFISLISDHVKWNKKIDEVCSILGTDLFEAAWIEYGYDLFDKLLSLELDSAKSLIFLVEIQLHIM